MASAWCLVLAAVLISSLDGYLCETSLYKFPFLDPSLPADDRTDDLVRRLTLEEIAPQTVDDGGGGTPAISRLGIKPYEWSTECIRGQVGTNGTAFPHSIGLAATFNSDLIFKMAEAISMEVRAYWNYNRGLGKYYSGQGLTCFSPVINIARHPLWGRNQETYGEDPYLSGSLSQAFVAGLRGNDTRYLRVGAGCKHFDIHGGPEDIPVSRFSFNTNVSERDWRMTFLPAFRMCVEAGSESLMCSYNSINGTPACANRKLLTDILRKEWGFKGYVVSDAGAINNIRKLHHFTKDDVDSATVAILAGTNLELGVDAIFKNQLEAVKQGKLKKRDIKRNVWPLFKTRIKLGEFDPLDMNPYNFINVTEIQAASHRALALKAAQQSFVLLKNDYGYYSRGLPISTSSYRYSNIAIIGPMANNTAQLYGDYAANVVTQYASSPLEGLSQIARSASYVKYASGCDDTNCQNYDSSAIKSAVRSSRLVFICLGTGQAVEAEGRDRNSLQLPGKQLDLLKDAVRYSGSDYSTNIVLLLFNAGPLDITWAKLNSRVDAILACSFPAQSTGKALYNVVTNTGPDAVPAGRLSMTWPAYIDQVPPITDYGMDGHTYRYFKGDPLYPFGYGLSYTTFTYSNLKVTPTDIYQGQSVKVQVTVRNNGYSYYSSYSADEVIQVYLTWPSYVPVPVPKLQLVAFNRTYIPAGKSVDLTFTIEPRRMEVWADQGMWKVPSGAYNLYVGGQQPNQRTTVSSNVLRASFNVQCYLNDDKKCL